jgi:hypothetical protein
LQTLDGAWLRTLREAVAYLAKTVPKSELDMAAVTTAAEMLTYAAEREMAWVFLARMATASSRVAALAMKRGKSVDFTGYWQRHVAE